MNLSTIQQTIIDTLLNLMNHHSYHDITVIQLTKEADIPRRSFYAHFKNKTSVLELAIQNLKHIYQTYLPEDSERTIQNFATAFFEFSKNNAPIIQLLIRQHMMPLLQKEFECYLENYYSQLSDVHSEIQNYHILFSSSYHAAGLCRLLVKWIHSGMQESPETMSHIYIQLINITPYTKH